MKIGTRGSDLALWQARLVRALLLEQVGVEAEIEIIKTQGDLDQKATFDKMEGKGFFTKEIEAALLDRSVDLAVHSLKDLQTTMPPGLALGAILNRADRRDMLLARPESIDASQLLQLKRGASVGTTSARRVAQLKHLRPDIEIRPLRGNVPTRVRKLREGEYDAILVASAGMDRLALPLEGLVAQRIPESVLIPAPGQGALAIQIRDEESDTARAVHKLNDGRLRQIVLLEREILRQLEGGCQLPLGSTVDAEPQGFRLQLFLGGDNGRAPRRVVVSGANDQSLANAAVHYLTGKKQQGLTPGQTPRVWITREPDRAHVFLADLSGGNVDVAAIPTFVAVEAGDTNRQRETLTHLENFDWIVFTSQVTATRFKDMMDKYHVRFPGTTRLAAVGRKTAQAMTEARWRVDFTSHVADAESLGEEFLAQHGNETLRMLFPCSAKAAETLERTMSEGGITLERLVCYDTVAHPDLISTVAALPGPDIVAFTSPSAVDFLLGCESVNQQILPVSMGPSTTARLRERGFALVWEPADRSLEGLAEVVHGLLAH